VVKKKFEQLDIARHKNISISNGFVNYPSFPFSEGQVYKMKNAKFDRDIDCGWFTKYKEFKECTSTRNVQKFKKLAFLVIPMADLFQHFMDGVMPKIMQARSLLEGYTILLHYTPNAIVQDFLRKGGYTVEKFQRGVTYEVEDFLFTCRTPPYNPPLWRGISDFAEVPQNKTLSKIYWMGRRNASNGRAIRNEGEFLTALRNILPGEKVIEFDHRNFPSLQKIVNELSEAKLIIGPHGGALYNQFFFPQNTKIVELINNVEYDNRVGSPLMIWVSSGMLGQEYWRVYVEGDYSGMQINIEKSLKAVKQALKIQETIL